MTSTLPTPARDAAHRDDIDGLRAVSVGAVVIAHLGATWLPGGFVGVDVFFVISGYLITGILARDLDGGRFSFLDFYERRLRRLYPALLAMLAVTAPIAWYLFLVRDLKAFGLSLAWTPLFASNFVFMGQTGYFDPDAATKPLLHTWSLGVEEQYYLLFPLLLVGAKRFGVARLPVVAGLVAVSFLASVAAGILHRGDAYYLLPTRVWEIGAGALLALVPPRLSDGARGRLGVVGLGLVVVSTVVIDETQAFPGWIAVLPVGGTVAVLASGVGPAARLLATAPFAFLGRISYSVYLWHWPPIVFLHWLTHRPPTAGEAVAIAAATVVVAWGSTVLLEAPIRARRVLASRWALFTAFAGVSAVLVGLGFLFAFADVSPSAATPGQAALAAVERERVAIAELCPGVDAGIVGERPACRIGAGEGAVRFALLGDSHARVAAGALDAAGRATGRGGLYLARTGCPPLPGLEYFDDSILRCDANLTAALAAIAAEPEITDVFVVARWARAVAGLEYGRPKARPLPIFDGGKRVGEGERQALFAERLMALVDRLGDKRVHVVASVPEVPFDVPAALSNAIRLGREPPPGPVVGEHLGWQAAPRALFATVAQVRPRLDVIDPTAVFCDAERCAVTGEAGPLYSDSDHLSRAGAMRLEPLFARALGAAGR